MHALIDRGSWSDNGRHRWSRPPDPRRRRWLLAASLVLATLMAVGSAGAGVYILVNDAKLTKAEEVLRAMAVREGWDDEKLERLLDDLHRDYQGR